MLGTGHATWFGGIELRPSVNTTAIASVDVQQMETGLDRVVVCFIVI
jgi:hypothetical protein